MTTTVVRPGVGSAPVRPVSLMRWFGSTAAALTERMAQQVLRTLTEREAPTARDLLALAERYEATHPSYAADLRAAAQAQERP
jgi:hypothetical protein